MGIDVSTPLKSHLRGTRFRDDGELNAARETWFGFQTDDFYFKGHRLLKRKVDQRWIIGKNNAENIFRSVS